MTRIIRVVATLLAAMYIGGGGFTEREIAQGAEPKGRVSLVIAAEPGAPMTSYHSWAKDLGQAGVRNVRIRSARSTDKLGIKSHGSQQMPAYDVLGHDLGRWRLALAGRAIQAGRRKWGCRMGQ